MRNSVHLERAYRALCGLLLATALLLPQSVSAGCEDQRLVAVMVEVTHVADTVNWRTVGSGITMENTLSHDMPVLLIASFESSSTSSSAKTVEYRLTADSTAISPTMGRTILDSADLDMGVLVTVDSIPVGQSREFALQHRRPETGGTRATSGTLIALPLVTHEGHALRWAMARQSSDYDSNDTGNYALVTNCQLSLVLDEQADVYLVSSANVQQGAGSGYRVGEWRILWRKKGEIAWREAGSSSIEPLPIKDYRAVHSAATLVEALPAGEYEFALAFRKEEGSGFIETRRATLVGVALTVDVGGSWASFPASQVSGGHTTDSTAFTSALAGSFDLAADEQVYLGAQYTTGADASTEGAYRLALGGVAQAYPQRRYISDSTDRGSGASVWLGAAAEAGSYRAELQQRSGVAETPISLDANLIGIRLKSICGLPTAVVMGSFTAQSAPGGVILRWQTGSELGVVGFRLERAHSLDGFFAQLAMIPATGGVEGAEYLWIDREVTPGVRYYYRIESLGGVGGATIETTEALHWRFFWHLPFTPVLSF